VLRKDKSVTKDTIKMLSPKWMGTSK